MVKSMTGYGQATVSNEQCTIQVEIRTVNHRFFECSNIRLPRRFLFLEDVIRKEVKSVIHRGKVDVFVKVDGESLVSKHFKVNWHLLQQYKDKAEQIREFLSSNETLSMEHVLQHEHLTEWVEEESDVSGLDKRIVEAIQKACTEVNVMREREGSSINTHFNELLTELNHSVTLLKALVPEVNKVQEEKLFQRLKDIVLEAQLDEGRMVTELGLILDKSDISEELSRLQSHWEQFKAILLEDQPIGRKLDFLVQEMNREANTIGSKAIDLQVKQQVVLQKSLMEKLKEQVQNVE
ncbi:YicC/YloC family endoribonuclease [Alkalihalobacillus pseudalcaliphilus]|uniref:YicC/YloC family endoribonuclease n=1 Tax=Alkalihalobacillus pseudalcaliphilus TaxID=79884 RepID=UPI00064DE7FA|nr:YicC/YloC family endoribonuclease [Alkalihalobacillus pseudalcaliphilus]KMK77152.1 hypothetical protein AB990_06270 [Alkalihalobacillus pseudalcaliphilus]